MRVCKCPQLPILASAAGSGGGPARLLTAQGTQVDIWQLGVAHNQQQQVCCSSVNAPALLHAVLGTLTWQCCPIICMAWLVIGVLCLSEWCQGALASTRCEYPFVAITHVKLKGTWCAMGAGREPEWVAVGGGVACGRAPGAVPPGGGPRCRPRPHSSGVHIR